MLRATEMARVHGLDLEHLAVGLDEVEREQVRPGANRSALRSAL
jgi:hypothetical protein